MGYVMVNQESQNSLGTTLNPLDHEEFRRQGHMIIDFLADYYKNIEKYPVRSQVEPGYLQKLVPDSAPYLSEPIENIIQDVKDHIIPGINHWQSPNHFGYYQANTSTAGFLGEMLCNGFNVVGFNWISSPAATELESIVMDWFGKMLQLPSSFLFSGGGGGVLQGSTSEAVLCTITAARDRILTKMGADLRKLVIYGSDQTNPAIWKVAKVVGINPKNFRPISTSISTGFALTAESLQSQILNDIEAGLVPFFLCTTVGTTSTSAADPLRSLCKVAQKYNIWVHVEAAYAGSACICPEFRHFLDGIEAADSFSLNAHKWFFTPLDCSCLWVKNPSTITKALSISFDCLKNKPTKLKQVVDYKDWQISLGRRFRALKLWLVLRSYGVANLKSFIRKHVSMAKHFEGLVRKDKRFEVVVERNFAMVCFRVLPSALEYGEEIVLKGVINKFNQDLLESINESGKVFMTHTEVDGAYVIRFAAGATLTEHRHIDTAWKAVQEHLSVMLKERERVWC